MENNEHRKTPPKKSVRRGRRPTPVKRKRGRPGGVSAAQARRNKKAAQGQRLAAEVECPTCSTWHNDSPEYCWQCLRERP